MLFKNTLLHQSSQISLFLFLVTPSPLSMVTARTDSMYPTKTPRTLLIRSPAGSSPHICRMMTAGTKWSSVKDVSAIICTRSEKSVGQGTGTGGRL